MSPTKIDSPSDSSADSALSGKYSDDDAIVTGLSNDAKLLKSLMAQQQHNNRRNRGESSARQMHASAESMALECDVHAGCHRGYAGHEPSQQKHRQQQFALSEAARLGQSSISSGEDGPDSIVLDDYERLEELYRNCHHSTGNGYRYNQLLDCASQDHNNNHDSENHKDRRPKQYHHHLRLPEKGASASHSSFKYLPMHTTVHSNMVTEFTPGTVALALVSLLLVAMMLVELVDVLCRIRKSLFSRPPSLPDGQDENIRQRELSQFHDTVNEDLSDKLSQETCV